MDRSTAAVRLLAGDKEPVRLATTGNITLSGLDVIDGVTPVAGDRILVKNQTDQRTNGIYTASVGTWRRAPDAATARTLIGGMKVAVQDGTANGGHIFALASDRPDIGSDNIVWSFYLSTTMVDDIRDAADDGLERVVNVAADILATAWAATNAADFASRAAAEMLAIPSTLTYLRTAGYAAAGDGGAALYKKVDSEPSGTGKFQSTDGVWWRLSEREINVEEFGALGDGVEDDTSAIQAAADEAAGRILNFTPGKSYFISEQINLSPNTLVFGNGAKLINTGTGFDFLNIAAGCKVLSLHATGIGTAGSTIADGFQHAYKFVGVSNAPSAPTFIDGVEIHNCNLTGFQGYGIFGQFASNAKITGCRIKDVGYAGIMVLSPLHVEIRSNLVDTVGPGIGDSAYGISCTRETTPPLDENPTASPAPFDVLMTQNIVLNNPVYTAYDIHAGNHILVIGNRAINVHHGVNCTFDSPGSEVANTNIIAGNLLVGTYEGCGIRMGGQSSAGPTLITANANTIVEGNIIKHFGNEDLELAAMHFFATSGVICRGNLIIEPEWGGINWYFLNDGFRCEGNTIVSVLGTTVIDPTFIRASSIGNRGYIGGNTLQFKPTLVPSSYNSVVGVAIADHETNVMAFGRNEITLGGANNVTYNVGASVKVLQYPTRQVGYVDVALASAASSATASFDFPEFFSATSPPIFVSGSPANVGIGSVRFAQIAFPTVAYTGMTVLVATATGAAFGEDGTVRVRWEAEGF